ncbi:hypothetical protein [Variovorax saccharolyticus]|uniref:hypothetical protein n=1 Tax=Variovorax saccharolyticus TaxID=3053516 RepID=UPI0025749D88|nr:hypothetical protein [Variovorax sp. J22R187]MDM0022098.1 hypothetical protein [Variovorax sp. J22R187]
MDLQSIARAGFLALAGLFLGASRAQQPSSTPRIGILMNGAATNNVAMAVVKAGVCLSLHEFQDDREPAPLSDDWLCRV